MPFRWRRVIWCALVVPLLSAPADGAPAATTDTSTRTEAEVEALISKAGQTRPDWWDSVKLTYPKTLDLTFRQSKEGWKPNKYIGQYIISNVRPFPKRWRLGAKVLEHAWEVNRGNARAQRATADNLAMHYGIYLEDWARAAHWWRVSLKLWGDRPPASHGVQLAECYRRLGNRAMAVRQASAVMRQRWLHVGLIKLWSDLDDLPKALSVAEKMAKAGVPDQAYLTAADACLRHGTFDEAREYYRKVVGLKQGSRRMKKMKQYARSRLAAVKGLKAIDLARVPDGRYTGAAVGYRGPITVAVTVKKGRITDVTTSQTGRKEDWPGASLTATPRQIVEKQTIVGVDAITGATSTSQAVICGAAQAIAKGMK